MCGIICTSSTSARNSTPAGGAAQFGSFGGIAKVAPAPEICVASHCRAGGSSDTVKPKSGRSTTSLPVGV